MTDLVTNRAEPPGSAAALSFQVSGRSLLALLAVLLACVAVRVWLIGHAQMISRDGVTYVKMAREWSADPMKVVRKYEYHVGYPVMIDAMHRVLSAFGLPAGPDGWELAARLVSLLGACLAMTALFLFCSLAFDWHVALLSGLMLSAASKWASLGADVMSDVPAVALQLWAVVLALVALRQLRRGSVWAMGTATLVGLCAGAGYLVRPESLLAVGMAGGLWLAWQVCTRGMRWRLTIGAGVMAGVAALACAAPYMLAIGTLTKKKRLDQIVSAAGTFPLAKASDVYDSGLRELVNRLAEAMHPALFFLALIWLVLWAGFRLATRGGKRPFSPAPSAAGAAVMLIAAAALAPVALGLHDHVSYLSHRHVLLLGLLLAPLGGAGLLLLAYLLCDLLRRPSRTFRLGVAYGLAAAIGGAMVAHALRPMKQQHLYYRHAATWLAPLLGPEDYVLARSPYIFHYAQARGEYFYPDGLTGKMLMDRVNHGLPRPTYLVYTDLELREAEPAVAAMLSAPPFQQVHVVQSTGRTPDTIRVYRLQPPRQ